MAAQDFSAQKRMGRPPGRVRPETAPVRIPVEILAAVDAWAADQSQPLSRPEAVRRALTDHLRAKGYLSDEGAGSSPTASPAPEGDDRYADADPNEAVMVTGVGPMILHRAVRKRLDWSEHHGLSLVSVFRGADKEPNVFDMGDLGRLAELERFR